MFRCRPDAGARNDFRPRALRVFRDESALSANPHLWSSIEEALDARREDVFGAGELDPARDLEAHLGAGIGIFSGGKARDFKIRISQLGARWVLEDPWHPAQRVETQPDGSLLITVPLGEPSDHGWFRQEDERGWTHLFARARRGACPW